jgi:hypothetical protein
MPGAHFNQRVNGALVVARPDSKVALTFAQYREETLRKQRRAGSKWGPVLADEVGRCRLTLDSIKTRVESAPGFSA